MAQYRWHPPRDLPANRLGWLTWGEIYQWLADRRVQYAPEQVNWIANLDEYLADRSLL
jgi:hypothetical protein